MKNKSKLINDQKTAAYVSMNEMNVMKQQQQSIRDMERDMYFNKLKRQEEIENQRKREEKEKMKYDQANYSKILQMQHKSKIDKQIFEKEADKKFSEAERIQLTKQDEDRNRFFAKLSHIQKENDMKQK